MLRLLVLLCWVASAFAFSSTSSSCRRRCHPALFISSGFSFQDDKSNELLVSVQKPLGLVLEQQDQGSPVVVAEVESSGSAGRAGVQVGDVLLAVKNADMTQLALEQVMQMIGQAPQVVNLRFLRVKTDD